MAVLFIDLDRFKAVNDTHGHRTGDELLVAVAERLVGLVRPGDTVARLSGDEFVVVCEELTERSGSEALAGRLSPALAEPFILFEVEVVGASVGIAFAHRTSSSERVLEDADRAMYQAKRMGGGRHGIVLLGQQPVASLRARLERDLQTA